MTAADLLVEAAEFVAALIVKVRVYCDGGGLVGGAIDHVERWRMAHGGGSKN